MGRIAGKGHPDTYSDEEVAVLLLAVSRKEITLCETCDRFFDYVSQKIYCDGCGSAVNFKRRARGLSTIIKPMGQGRSYYACAGARLILLYRERDAYTESLPNSGPNGREKGSRYHRKRKLIRSHEGTKVVRVGEARRRRARYKEED